MLVVAVTGGIGSGKSTVADQFKTKGVPVIDTDEVSRRLVRPGQILLEKIIAEFGDKYLDEHGRLNRKALRTLIFTDPRARNKLESLMHPAIHAAVTAQLRQIEAAYCLVLIPLLTRSRQHYPYDRVLFVDAPEATRIQRTAQRDQQDPASIKQIIASQAPREELLALADDVLDNGGDMTALASRVEALHHKYLALSQNLD